jgi:hypothetical protein
VGGALLFGLKPSMFGWKIDNFISNQYFGSDNEASKAATALAAEYGLKGLNENFRSLVQGTTTIIGRASSRMQRAYASLLLGDPKKTMGGSIGAIDCNIGGNSKCCSEAAACIKYFPMEDTHFQLYALSSEDLVTINGQRITPEMGGYPLSGEDICTVGSRVFAFLLPSPSSAYNYYGNNGNE